jgi:hypothetical protein
VNSPSTLSIGQLARRTGLSVSAIRYYEARGLVRATRGAGNQRRFMRSDIRRLSFALIAQQSPRQFSRYLLPTGSAPASTCAPNACRHPASHGADFARLGLSRRDTLHSSVSHCVRTTDESSLRAASRRTASALYSQPGALIHAYTLVLGRPPGRPDIHRCFRVTFRPSDVADPRTRRTDPTTKRRRAQNSSAG